jgi:RimJ/RimL family protein N-acetyltransferase
VGLAGSGEDVGGSVRLAQLERADFAVIRPWIDPALFRIFREPVDDAQLESLLTRHEDDRPVSLGYRIVRASDSEVVGMVHAVIDWGNQLAHVQQIVIGVPGVRNSGVGAASLRLLMRICFEDLGLHRVQIFVDDDNAAAIACYKKAGFSDEGLMRDAAKTKDGYKSWHSMSVLEDEWRG